MEVLKRLAVYGLRHKWRLAGAYCAMAVTAVSYMVIPRLMGSAIDEALASGLRSELLILAGTIVVVALVRGASSYVEGYLFESVAQLVPFHLRGDLFRKLQHLSFAFHDKQQTGNLMSRATSDVEAVRYFPSYGVAHGVYLVIYVGGVVALMAAMNWRLGLLVMALFSVAMWRSLSVVPRMVTAWREAQTETGHMATVVQESLTGIGVVKAFGAYDYEQAKFEEKATAVRAHQTFAGLLSVVRKAQSNLLLNVAILMVLWIGALEVSAGRLTAGEIATFMLYLGILAGETFWAGFLIVTWAKAVSGGQRIFEVLDAESPVRERRGAVTLPRVRGHVRFDHVSLSYDSKVSTLRDVDFEVQPGELVAIVGGPGSGKSTIVHLIPRFYDVSGGRVTLDGVDVRDTTLESLRHNVGIVMQDTFAFAATIRDNIAYGADDASNDAVVQAAKVAQLHEFIEGLPEGYDTRVGERGITLSGGQRQRLAIARTVLLDPPVLILDDSTSSVDVGTEYEIQQALAEVVKARTTLVIAHRLSTVRNADQILVLDQGEVVERGTHQELVARDGMYRRIYEVQLRPPEEARLAPAYGSGDDS
jgi:ATP-binding cassette subfamily B protein